MVNQERVTTWKPGDVLQTYVLDAFQILHVGHLSLDNLKDYTVEYQVSLSFLDTNEEHSRLALRFLFSNPVPHVLSHQVVPLEHPRRSLAHTCL